MNLEDAMISGLLSTLNEDAHEDILVEELINSTTGPAAAYLGGSNDSLVSSASNYSTSNQPKEAEVMHLMPAQMKMLLSSV